MGFFVITLHHLFSFLHCLVDTHILFLQVKIMHPAVHELKKRLLHKYGERLVRFLVFGSYARGEAASDSDIDIFVTLSGKVNWKLEIEIWDTAFEIDLEYDVILDVKIYSEEDILYTIRGRTPFMETVMEEGVSV